MTEILKTQVIDRWQSSAAVMTSGLTASQSLRGDQSALLLLSPKGNISKAVYGQKDFLAVSKYRFEINRNWTAQRRFVVIIIIIIIKAVVVIAITVPWN